MLENDISVVFSVRKQTPIGPRSINSLLYGATEFLSSIVPEKNISTQVTLNSPGDIIFLLDQVKDFLTNNWTVIFGILVLLGGGSAFSFKLPGIIEIIKSILSAKDDYRLKHAEADEKELQVLEKKLELYNKIKASGINPEALRGPVDALASGCVALEVEPIALDDEAAATLSEEASMQESPDTEDE